MAKYFKQRTKPKKYLSVGSIIYFKDKLYTIISISEASRNVIFLDVKSNKSAAIYRGMPCSIFSRKLNNIKLTNEDFKQCQSTRATKK